MAYDTNLLDLATILAQSQPLQAQIINLANRGLPEPQQSFALREILVANGIPAYVANAPGGGGGIEIGVGTMPALVGLATGSKAYAGLGQEVQARSLISALVEGGPATESPFSPSPKVMLGLGLAVVLVLVVVAVR